jgi:hypothetical protein
MGLEIRAGGKIATRDPSAATIRSTGALDARQFVALVRTLAAQRGSRQ